MVFHLWEVYDLLPRLTSWLRGKRQRNQQDAACAWSSGDAWLDIVLDEVFLGARQLAPELYRMADGGALLQRRVAVMTPLLAVAVWHEEDPARREGLVEGFHRRLAPAAVRPGWRKVFRHYLELLDQGDAAALDAALRRNRVEAATRVLPLMLATRPELMGVDEVRTE